MASLMVVWQASTHSNSHCHRELAADTSAMKGLSMMKTISAGIKPVSKVVRKLHPDSQSNQCLGHGECLALSISQKSEVT
jgi:hypothetical protein